MTYLGNKTTATNWMLISTIILGKFKYSRSARMKYSYTENVGEVHITTGQLITASRLIAEIGEYNFKKLIEYNWRKNLQEKSLKTFGNLKIRHLVTGFKWRKTAEGYEYWRNVGTQLMRLERSNDIRSRAE